MSLVLIVDDNPQNLYLLRMLLEAHGHQVEEATDGQDALARARIRLPDLVVSDLLMPGMDGYTLLRHWKDDPALAAQPFLVYTATYTEPKDERLALDLGADGFLVKPAEPELLLARITALLDAVSSRQQAVARPRESEDVLLREYNAALIRKLEKRAAELQEANRKLLDEIAERRQAEVALRLRERAIDAAAEGICISDPAQPDNPLIFVNAAFERITGYRAEEALGRNCRFLQGAGTDPEAVAQLREALSSGSHCSVELLNYRKDGRPFWNRVTLSPVRDEDGRITHHVSQQADVSERRQLEEQLRQSQKLEALGQLAAGIAHDFNNLLTVINGYSEVLADTVEDTGRTGEMVHAIQQAGERASALTRQLLAFSRKQVVAPQLVDLNVLVSGAERLLGRLIGEDIILRTTLHPGSCLARTDPGHMEQVLVNLAVNARDAMPTGGNLTIETQVVELDQEYCRLAGEHLAPGEYVLLAVSDTGCGMDREVRERSFEPFFSTKASGQGTGMGLAIVHGIVRQWQGHVTVYSEPGQGATFKVYLPLGSGRPTADSGRRPVQDLPPGSETLLLVEDDESVRAYTAFVLNSCGYRVLEAADGRDALRLAAGTPGQIDLLVSDVVLPHLGGRALAEELVAARPGLRVLFLSGYTDDAVIRHGVLKLEMAFLQKPFTPSALARKVRAVLDS